MIVAGRLSQKMAPVLRQVYDQMMEPKWVISMGVCASTGGMFNNYALVQGSTRSCRGRVHAGVPARAGDPYPLHSHPARADPQGEITRRRAVTGGGAGIHLEEIQPLELGPTGRSLVDRASRTASR